MNTLNKNNKKQDSPINNSSPTNENRSLASDGPITKDEGTDSVNMDDNGTAKSFDRDQEELNYGFRDGDLDTDPTN